MIFYLGVHQVNMMTQTDVPLFVSHRRLRARKTFPRARGIWALDSGAFSEIAAHGRWEESPEKYVADVRRYQVEVGQMQWAAIQDWMCEPHMLAKTGLSVRRHQELAVDSLSDLRGLAPEVPWAPVLQGWHPDDYLRHWEMYERRGFDLRREKIVGVGSVCRRNKGAEIQTIATSLRGLKLHGFGVKAAAAAVAARHFTSTDSMAWSFTYRRAPPLPGHVGHKNCANCIEAALIWRGKLLKAIDRHMEAA